MEAWLDIQDDAGRLLAQLDKRLAGKVLQRALVDMAKPLKKEMKAEAPKRSGDLRRSIRHKSKMDHKTRTASVNVGLLYNKKNRKGYVAGIMQERGTLFNDSQPFIRPVAEQHLPDLERELTEFIKAQLDL